MASVKKQYSPEVKKFGRARYTAGYKAGMRRVKREMATEHWFEHPVRKIQFGGRYSLLAPTPPPTPRQQTLAAKTWGFIRRLLPI